MEYLGGLVDTILNSSMKRMLKGKNGRFLKDSDAMPTNQRLVHHQHGLEKLMIGNPHLEEE